MLKDTVFLGDVQIDDSRQIQTLSSLGGFGHGRYWPLWHQVMGPGHLLARQHELETAIPDLSAYDPRACVCFGFGYGEDNDDRGTTRFGGLPFWPKDRPWPTAQDGSPKEFLGQFDFRNVIWPEPLPGDILTVHFDFEWDGDDCFDGPADGSAATLVWHDSRQSDHLVTRADLPPECLGSEMSRFYSRGVLVTDYKISEPEQSEYWQSLTIHGTKIGGHSPLYGNNWQDSFSDLKEPVFLCSLGSILPPDKSDEQNAWLPLGPGGKIIQEDAWKHWISFIDVGVFVIAYEKGNPLEMHWICYLP